MTTQTTVQILEFKPFKELFQVNFSKVIKDQTHLFVVDVDKDTLWNTYLNSFPEELRQQFNCNSCRQFIKNYGNLVAIKNNTLFSLWNFNAEDKVYQTVVDNLDHLVINATIKDIFVTKVAKLGTDSNIQRLEDNSTIRWQHFYYELPRTMVDRSSKSEASIMGEFRDNKNVFKRSLTELTMDATQTVLELIAQNSLYRGAEFKSVLEVFLKCQQEYSILPETEKDNYCWVNSIKLAGTVSKIRNTSIGTLLIDISEGVDLDVAVTKFEKVMAPTNYKRPTAIISKRMVEEAEKKIAELGLQDSLARRFATSNDLTVNNILWKAGNVKTKSDTSLAASLFNELKEDITVNPKQFSKLESVSITDFIEKIVPKANSIELLLENKHEGNLVSLIAPGDIDAPSLFKWDNGFSWSYNKGLADSMKERVKAAGGKVEGELRCSLEWFNYDDLDIHLVEPNGNKIYYSQKQSPYTSGHLDVDMNAGGSSTRTPVENIIYPYEGRILEGEYILLVHNFAPRERIDVGFSVQIECQGELFTFDYNKAVGYKEYVEVAKFKYSKAEGIKFTTQIESKTVSKQMWGLNSNKFHKVNLLSYSPNYWDGQYNIGNKHYLFMLEGCKSTEARGFFNEFLKQELLSEKKVFEALGSKMKVEPSDNQLSGVGFSSTQKAEFIVKVTGQFTRTLKVVV